MKVLYSAAHGGYRREAVPLGGGAAVFEHLVEEWNRTQPFSFRALTPDILGPEAPLGREVVRFSEQDYARFSRSFERATTAEILRHDPKDTVILVNDVSEGPDFKALDSAGFRVYTIYHVDVVAYIADIYLGGWLRPETTVKIYNALRPLFPQIARLVWEKQEASVRFSKGLIVPSLGMKDVLLRCYPWLPAGNVHVIPWGSWTDPSPGSPADLRAEFGVPDNARVLLTLSRISPEKGQHLLLESLIEWEGRSDYPAEPLWVFICGDAAFMQGKRYLGKLRGLSQKLRRTRVVFPGYVTGERKNSFFALADLFVFPSLHESYGLTLLEALSHGLPAVCLDHHGARSVMQEEFGRIVEPSGLRDAIAELLADPVARNKMAVAARTFAMGERFSDRAAQIARIISVS